MLQILLSYNIRVSDLDRIQRNCTIYGVAAACYDRRDRLELYHPFERNAPCLFCADIIYHKSLTIGGEGCVRSPRGLRRPERGHAQPSPLILRAISYVTKMCGVALTSWYRLGSNALGSLLSGSRRRQ